MPVITSCNGTEILVDEEDFDRLSGYCWVDVIRSKDIVYASAYIPELKRHEFMHRLILGAKPKQIVDHKNRNSSDNRKNNLRFATHQQNMQNSKMKVTNTLGFKGVQQKPSGRFSARIRNSEGKRLYLGTYDTPEQAHSSYLQAANKYHGEFACQ